FGLSQRNIERNTTYFRLRNFVLEGMQQDAGSFRMSEKFSSPGYCIPNSSIRVSKDGNDRILSIPQFEAMTGVVFAPELHFSDFSVLQDIVRRTKKIHTKG